MPVILTIETSTSVCSVATFSDEETIFERIETEGPSHAALLGVFVEEAIKHLRAEKLNLDTVAISCGPGSYTGLRIGVSEAKGLCYGLNIPLIAINTPLLMASGLINNKELPADALLCPMIDARRMEVYSAIYGQNLDIIREIQADIVTEDSYHDLLDNQKVIFFGNGAEKCKETITHPNAIFIDNIHPLASDMKNLAINAFMNKDFVDVAYFEPFYLKEFIATTPKNKVI